MEGINLSQSMQESRRGSSEEKRTLLDTGMMVAFAVFIVAALIWGGLAWYVSTVDQKIAAVNGELAESVASLAGKEADRRDNVNPLVRGGRKLIPSVTRVFRGQNPNARRCVGKGR